MQKYEACLAGGGVYLQNTKSGTLMSAGVQVYVASDVDARITALQGALGCSECPYPIGADHSVADCIKAGKCGCENKSLMGG